ncbi:hypothetical protein D3P09_02255 [Paenibacillus pinisoli]|uniref:Phage tail tape measure protein n=1 Tax=Paenibacillus pinisoli TaxID=1276110 RepID=A0A3A6PI37_9BACL|nr:hypothetical protein [Paenibacillus pinisoli]RJX40867.1 hypothetical protein D3P09_02255 [Paenibacillus pinisoli]
MPTVTSTLKLMDAMTAPIQSITQSMDALISSVEKMYESIGQIETLSKSMSSTKAALISVEGEMADAIGQAVLAQEKLNNEISKQPPAPTVPAETPGPISSVTMSEPVKWDSWDGPEMFQTSGVERYAQEITALQSKMDELATSQMALDRSDISFLPDNAAEDINALQTRLEQLYAQLQQVTQQKDRMSANASPEAFDALNDSAGKIRKTIHDAIDEQNAMNRAMQAGDLSKVQSSYTKLHNIIDSTEGEIRNNKKEQERFNKSLKDGEKAGDGLLGKITAIGATYIGINQMKSFLGTSLAGANDQIRAEQRLQSIMSNVNGMTQDGIELVKQRANELEATTSIAASTGIFGQSQLAEYVYDPSNVSAMTESMYNLATETYGASVSQDQLMQTANLMGKVMMGDINALSRNGFKIDAIFSEAEQTLLKTGTEAERAALVIQMIDENLSGLSQAMGETPEGQAIRLANAWGSVTDKIGYGLMPIISQFSSYIMDNMPVIESIVMTVFGSIFSIIQAVMGVAMATATFFVDNWSWIEPILWGIVAAIAAYLIMTKGVSAALRIAAIAQALFNAIMNANPFVLIATLIIGVITALVLLWQKNDAFAAAMMRGWNMILNFFDQIPIFFRRIGNGIVNIFQSMRVKSLEIMESLINGVIDRVNDLIEKLNKIPGVSLDAVGHVEFASKAAAEAEAIKQAGEEAIAEMDKSAAAKAAAREQKVLDTMEDRARKREEEEKKKEDQFAPPPLVGGLDNGKWKIDDEPLSVDNVKQVDKIKDSVDISSEDLKMMRELAEMKNIQNYVTLQPSINFGDTHIRNESDLNTIVSRITTQLEQDIAASADAAYG